MKISEIMITRVVTVEMDDSLRLISELMTNAKIHHLLVTNRGKLCGIISDRDVLKATSPFLDTAAETLRDLEILNRRAHQIMTRNPVTVSADTDMQDAVQVLLDANVSCLPVITDEGRIEGIATWKDLIRAYVARFKYDIDM